MRLACPACNAEFALEVALGRDADAQALAGLLDQLVPELRPLLTAYLGLHRPAQRRLSIARAARLAGELLPDIRRGAINRKGREWAAPIATWRAGIEHMLAMRDKGSLTLPLSGHGYLYEVMAGMADKDEAAAERTREADARSRTHTAGPTPLAAVVDQVAAPVTAAAPAPYDVRRGPSRAALEMKAAAAARLAARQAGTGDADPHPATGA